MKQLVALAILSVTIFYGGPRAWYILNPESHGMYLNVKEVNQHVSIGFVHRGGLIYPTIKVKGKVAKPQVPAKKQEKKDGAKQHHL